MIILVRVDYNHSAATRQRPLTLIADAQHTGSEVAAWFAKPMMEARLSSRWMMLRALSALLPQRFESAAVMCACICRKPMRPCFSQLSFVTQNSISAASTRMAGSREWQHLRSY